MTAATATHPTDGNLIEMQVSIGHTSAGEAFRAVTTDELQGLVAQCAAETNQTAEAVVAKLAQGYTMWLSQLKQVKIRGFDAVYAAQQAAKRSAQRAVRQSADGYFNHQ